MKNYILERKVDICTTILFKGQNIGLCSIFSIFKCPELLTGYKLILKFYTTLSFTSTFGPPKNYLLGASMFFYTGNILKWCLYEMKHRDHIWEPVCSQINISMNIIYLPKKGLVWETAVSTKCNLNPEQRIWCTKFTKCVFY